MTRVAVNLDFLSSHVVLSNPMAKVMMKSMDGKEEGIKGVLGGCATDLTYQSIKLFPDFSGLEKESHHVRMYLDSIMSTELRNRYRRVFELSSNNDRLTYFKRLQQQGIGTSNNPKC